jgi:hypothetical protein
MALPLIGRLIGKPQPSRNQLIQQEQQRMQMENMKAQIINRPVNMPLKTPEQHHLEMLLNPDIPPRPHLDKFYALAKETARHLSLTNIPDPYEMHKINLLVSDLFRIASWSAPEYFEERQLKLESRILLLKSAGWTKNSRMIDSLNEQRVHQHVIAEQNTRPRETQGFIAGLLGGR